MERDEFKDSLKMDFPEANIDSKKIVSACLNKKPNNKNIYIKIAILTLLFCLVSSSVFFIIHGYKIKDKTQKSFNMGKDLGLVINEEDPNNEGIFDKIVAWGPEKASDTFPLSLIVGSNLISLDAKEELIKYGENQKNEDSAEVGFQVCLGTKEGKDYVYLVDYNSVDEKGKKKNKTFLFESNLPYSLDSVVDELVDQSNTLITSDFLNSTTYVNNTLQSGIIFKFVETKDGISQECFLSKIKDISYLINKYDDYIYKSFGDNLVDNIVITYEDSEYKNITDKHYIEKVLHSFINVELKEVSVYEENSEEYSSDYISFLDELEESYLFEIKSETGIEKLYISKEDRVLYIDENDKVYISFSKKYNVNRILGNESKKKTLSIRLEDVDHIYSLRSTLDSTGPVFDEDEDITKVLEIINCDYYETEYDYIDDWIDLRHLEDNVVLNRGSYEIIIFNKDDETNSMSVYLSIKYGYAYMIVSDKVYKSDVVNISKFTLIFLDAFKKKIEKNTH